MFAVLLRRFFGCDLLSESEAFRAKGSGTSWQSSDWDVPSSVGSTGSVPGRGANIPHASWPEIQNIKQKRYCNRFSKDFKTGPHQDSL